MRLYFAYVNEATFYYSRSPTELRTYILRFHRIKQSDFDLKKFDNMCEKLYRKNLHLGSQNLVIEANKMSVNFFKCLSGKSVWATT